MPSVIVNAAKITIDLSVDDPRMGSKDIIDFVFQVLTETCEFSVHRIEMEEFWDGVLQNDEEVLG